MDTSLILRAEAASARYFLRLLLSVPEQTNLGADCASIALRAFQIEGDPAIIGCDRVRVQERGAFLIRDNDIELACITEVRQRNRTSVIHIGHTGKLRDFDKSARPVVDPNLLLLIP